MLSRLVKNGVANGGSASAVRAASRASQPPSVSQSPTASLVYQRGRCNHSTPTPLRYVPLSTEHLARQERHRGDRCCCLGQSRRFACQPRTHDAIPGMPSRVVRQRFAHPCSSHRRIRDNPLAALKFDREAFDTELRVTFVSPGGVCISADTGIPNELQNVACSPLFSTRRREPYRRDVDFNLSTNAGACHRLRSGKCAFTARVVSLFLRNRPVLVYIRLSLPYAERQTP